MKKTLLIVLALGAVLAPAATAGKGPKPKADQAARHVVACKAPRAVHLFGTFVAAGDGSFTMDVAKANAHGRKLVGKKGFAVKVDAKTKFVRVDAPAKLADLVAGDKLNVHASLCKAADVEKTELVARKVVAKAAGSTGATGATGASGATG